MTTKYKVGEFVELVVPEEFFKYGRIHSISVIDEQERYVKIGKLLVVVCRISELTPLNWSDGEKMLWVLENE